VDDEDVRDAAVDSAAELLAGTGVVVDDGAAVVPPRLDADTAICVLAAWGFDVRRA
jgi:hypothetical protein